MIWPFRRKPKPVVDERPVTWIEFLDRDDEDPTGLRHEHRMDWLYMNMAAGDYTYTSESDDFFPGRLRLYGFYSKSNAVLFKLTWGGK